MIAESSLIRYVWKEKRGHEERFGLTDRTEVMNSLNVIVFFEMFCDLIRFSCSEISIKRP